MQSSPPGPRQDSGLFGAAPADDRRRGEARKPRSRRPRTRQPRTGQHWTRQHWIWLGATVVVVVIAVAIASTLAAGRSPFSRQHGSSPGRAAAGGPRPAVGNDPAGAVAGGAASPAAVIPSLTARQLAGQRVIYSYSGLTPPASLLQLIRHGDAAGVIFFSANISSLAQIAAVTKELQQANASKLNPVRLPLLLMTDQEGGEVRRLPGQQPYLSEKQIGQSAHPAQQARIAGSGAAAALQGVGMNVNLAPVLDVFRKPGNFIDQFGRSYSSSAPKVSYLGTDFIKAQQAGGVAATAKHFPGLGAARKNQDTDVLPVTLNLSASTIRRVDELPYKAAISAGVKLVMVSWAVYPALDKNRPAGLSPVIVQGELRQRLGFSGVTITDALEAGALRSFGTIRHRSQLAALAGMDLLLCAAQKVGEGQQALSGLEGGYTHGALSQPAFKAAVARILALRAGLPG
jgi:beta-N-acetylhexosaminidase